jgi:hypothetical protein
MLKVLII